MSAPTLVRQAAQHSSLREWSEPGRRILAHDGGVLRVLGGPGSGKTTLLAELVADRILRRKVDPEQILVLTANRDAATALRSMISALLTQKNAASSLSARREPLVRTVHSYAFSVLRTQAVLRGAPQPRLLTGAEQDTIIRDLLAGDLEIGADYWPPRLRPALSLPGFAAELRDLILKAAERGLGPDGLVSLGRAHDCAEWIAAGTFWRQYEQVTLLRDWSTVSGPGATAPAMDAAELVSSALLACRNDPEVLAREHARVHHLFVDDAQHVDPQQYRLIRTVGQSARELVFFGDPDQAVFSFRGADPALLANANDGRTEVLTTSYRMAGNVCAAVSALCQRLPGSGPQRRLVSARSAHPGSVHARLFSSAAREAAWVADQIRRAHLLDGVPWSDIAVLVRSTSRTLPVLRRALLAAGVPLAAVTDRVPLAQLPSIRPFLEIMRCAADPHTLDQETAIYLLESVLGGADPLALRRLRRGLIRLESAAGGQRTSGELLVTALLSGDSLSAVDHNSAEPVRRIAGLLEIARNSLESGADVPRILWELWQASGLEQNWLSQVDRGGQLGAQADRDLDAMVALIEEAARYAEHFPGNSVSAFVDRLINRRIAENAFSPSAPRGNVVAVLTAHAAVGKEWAVVAIPGLQEGAWPDLRIRGTLLGSERMIDALSGIDPGAVVSLTAPLLAEERRLLVSAASRAKNTLLVSAVKNADEQPSRFFDELSELTAEGDEGTGSMPAPDRGLTLPELVGELRRVVCDEAATDDGRRARAATQLARLAQAGVPGAHPDSWYGLKDITDNSPLWTEDELISVSPSTIEVLTKCPLRWLVERHGGVDPAPLASTTGTLVHALVQAIAEGVSGAELNAKLDQAWEKVDAGAPWFSRRERERVQRMLDTFRAWFTRSRQELTQVAVERDISVEVPRKPGGPWLRVRGRVDRLELDKDGRPVVVDIKTGKNPVSASAAQQHPQLAVYQLAAQLGAFDDMGAGNQPGGARLLYVSKKDKVTGATERSQSAMDKQSGQEWLTAVQQAAASCMGPSFVAAENTDCSRCAAQICCPLQDSGRQVGQAGFSADQTAKDLS